MNFQEALAAVGQAIDEALTGKATAAPAAAPKAEKTPTAAEKKKAAAAAKKEAAAKKAAEPKPPTIDEVRDSLRRCIDLGDNDAATEVLEPFGVKKISDAEPDDFAAIIEAAEKYLDENSEGDGGALD